MVSHKITLLSKVGGIFKRSISQNSASSALNSAVTTPSTKLFVGGFADDVDCIALRDAFSRFGVVTDARVIYSQLTGNSTGYGFVSFADSNSANAAITAMRGKQLNGVGMPLMVQLSTHVSVRQRHGSGGVGRNMEDPHGGKHIGDVSYSGGLVPAAESALPDGEASGVLSKN